MRATSRGSSGKKQCLLEHATSSHRIRAFYWLQDSFWFLKQIDCSAFLVSLCLCLPGQKSEISNIQSFHKFSGTRAASTVTSTGDNSIIFQRKRINVRGPTKKSENHRRQKLEMIDSGQYAAVVRLGTTAGKRLSRASRS